MISVVIPTYKNREMFLHNLEHNAPVLKEYETVIVNDDPKESLSSALKPFPFVKLHENNHNLGFSRSVNEGIKKTKGSYIVLLNNDVLLQDDSFSHAVSYFEKNPKLFAVGFAQKEKDERLVGNNRIYFERGLVNHDRGTLFVTGKNAWAEGGACMIRKSIFDKLGGFDPLYSPFYWEDIDLSYRAWKAGYQVMFSTSIEVEHHHESTIGAYFSPSKMAITAFRNQFIFMWKNLTDRRFLLTHFFWLLPNLFIYLIKGQFLFVRGFIEALFKIPDIIKERQKIKVLIVRTDHELFAQFE